MRRARPAEEVEQQLAWGSGDAGCRFSSPRPGGPGGSGPLKFETCAAQPPREIPRRAGDVAPKRLVHSPLVGPGAMTVGPANVLMVDEELVEAGEPAHPSDAEEAWRRSRRNVVTSLAKSLSASAFLRCSAKRAHAPGRTSPGPARWS